MNQEVCPVPVGHQDQKGNAPRQMGTGMYPKRALDPFPGERAGELVDHHISTADQRRLAGFVRRKLNSLMYLHLNGLTLLLCYFPLAETGMSVFPAL